MKKSAIDRDIETALIEGALSKLPPVPRGHVRLFRAANRPGVSRGAGAHLSPKLETARIYLDNPGFGGDKLYAYDVADDYRLDLFKVESKHGYLAALDRLASELDIGDTDEEVVDGWIGRGLKRIYQVLENDAKAIAKAQEHYEWISYRDDFPANAETWRYLGDQHLTGILLNGR